MKYFPKSDFQKLYKAFWNKKLTKFPRALTCLFHN